MNARRCLYLLLAAGAVALVAALLSESSGVSARVEPPAQAVRPSPTPTLRPSPTPAPTRAVGWSKLAGAQAPHGLPKTIATMGGAGAGGGGDVCEELLWACRSVMSLSDVPVVVLYPGQGGTIVIGEPDGVYEMVGTSACRSGQSQAFSAKLTDPSGRAVPTITPNEDNTLYPESCFLAGPSILFRIENDGPVGTYTLSSQVGASTFTSTWEAAYDAPSIELVGVRSPVYYDYDYNGGSTRAGEPLRVIYHNFHKAANKSVDVGLYRLNECGGAPTYSLYREIVDSWRIQLDSKGRYEEEILVPTDAPPGRYIIAACAGGSCPAIGAATGSVYQPETYEKDGVEWVAQHFILKARSVEQRRVDPVFSYDGAQMRISPVEDASVVDTVKANGLVDMLSGTATVDEATWHWVKDSQTAKSGWILSDYLVPSVCGPSDGYLGLAWVAACDPGRREVALLEKGQAACDPGVVTTDLDDFAGTLIYRGLLQKGERLSPGPAGAEPNQDIAIENEAGSITGYIRFGGLGTVSGVWRASASDPDKRDGKICWRTIDPMIWRCRE